FLLCFFRTFHCFEVIQNKPTQRIKGTGVGHKSAHQFDMLRLVVFLSLLAFSLACKPSSSTTTPTTTPTTTTPTPTKAPTGGAPTQTNKQIKREVGQAHVLVETNLKFNPALNSVLEKAFKQGVEQHAHRHGVEYDHNLVYGKTERIGHNFAMGYKIYGADCEELENFISTGKKPRRSLIETVFAKGNGKQMIL
uniref:SCP domain-containing protein n=1 Tax=Haemonchus contortus TaxID=6289 RepID=A0A7I4YEQ2_HAECO